MKRISMLILILCACLLSVAWSQQPSGTGSNNRSTTLAAPKGSSTTIKGGSDKVELGVVINLIEKALDEAAKNPVEGFPHLQSVNVEVKTSIVKEKNGGVKLFVFNLGGKGGASNVTSMSFELKPPQEKKEAALSSVNLNNIQNALTQQIEAAKMGFLNAKASSTKLMTDKVEISLAFTVTKEVSAGVDTAKLLPIGLSASGKLSTETGNTIKLTFGQ